MTLPIMFRRVLDHWRLTDVEECSKLTPSDVTLVPSVGPAALDRLRLFLAHRDLTLRDDQTSDYWLRALKRDAGGDDLPMATAMPFTIIRDTNETCPFAFDSLVNRDGEPIRVEVEVQPLWSRGMADYTIKGMEHDVQIERKGNDLPSSLAQGRENFEAEISRLNDMCQFAAIVIEHEWSYYEQNPPNHGASGAAMARTWVGWMVKYPNVHWVWCDGRAMAEQMTFALLEKAYWHIQRAESKRRHRNLMLGEMK